MRVIKYKNIIIHYFNWKYKKDESAINAVNELKTLYSVNTPEQLVILVDATGVRAEPEAVKILSDLSRRKKAHAIAIVGLNEIQQIMAKKIRPDIFLSDSIVQAKNWLLKRSQSVVNLKQ